MIRNVIECHAEYVLAAVVEREIARVGRQGGLKRIPAAHVLREGLHQSEVLRLAARRRIHQVDLLGTVQRIEDIETERHLRAGHYLGRDQPVVGGRAVVGADCQQILLAAERMQVDVDVGKGETHHLESFRRQVAGIFHLFTYGIRFLAVGVEIAPCAKLFGEIERHIILKIIRAAVRDGGIRPH